MRNANQHGSLYNHHKKRRLTLDTWSHDHLVGQAFAVVVDEVERAHCRRPHRPRLSQRAVGQPEEGLDVENSGLQTLLMKINCNK